MHKGTVLRYFLATLLSTITLLLLFVFNANLGRFSSQAESAISQLLEREFRLAGPVHLTLDLNGDLALSAANVKLAATQWSAHAELLQIERLTAHVRLWSLFSKGPLIIESLSVDGATLRLEQDRQGNNNWTLLQAGDEDDLDPKRFQLPVLPESITLDNALLTLDSPKLQQTLTVSIDSLRENTDNNRAVELALAGAVNNRPLRIHAKSPMLDNFIDLRDIRLSLDGNLGEIAFQGKGAMDDLLHPTRPTADFHLAGPNVEYLLDLIKTDRSTSGPLNLTLQVQPAGEQMSIFLGGTFGEFKLTLEGEFVDLRSREVLDLDYTFAGPDLSRLATLLEINHVPADPFSVTGTIKRFANGKTIDHFEISLGEASLLADVAFENYPDPSGAKAWLQFDAPDLDKLAPLLRLHGEISSPVTATARLEPRPDGDGAQFQIAANTNNMTLTGTGELDDTPGFVGSHAQLNLAGPELATLSRALAIKLTSEAPFSMQLNLVRTASGLNVLPSIAEIGAERLSLEGTVGNQPLEAGTRLQLDMSGPSLALMLGALDRDIQHVAAEPYTLQGDLEFSQGTLSLHQFDAVIGDQHARATGKIARKPLSVDTRIVFDIRSPSLRAALTSKGFAAANVPEGEFSASGVLQGGEGAYTLQGIELSLGDLAAELSGNIAPADGLNGSRLTLNAEGRDLSRLLPGTMQRPAFTHPFTLSAEAHVNDGFLLIKQANVSIDKTQIGLDARLAMTPFMEQGSFTVSGKSPDLLRLQPGFGKDVTRATLPLALQGNGSWDANSLKLHEVVLELGDGQLRVDGTLQQPPDFTGTNMILEGNLPDLSVFSRLADRELPALPGRLKFHAVGQGNKLIVNDIVATLGSSDIVGDFSLQTGGTQVINANFHSRQLDLTSLLLPLQDVTTAAPQQPAAQRRQPGARRRSQEKLIPDTPIPLDVFEDLLATVKIRIDKLRLDAHTLRNVHLDSTVKDGAFTVSQLEFTADRGGQLQGQARLSPTARGGALQMRLSGESLSFGLPAETQKELLNLPQYEYLLALESEGKTVREMAASMNGYLTLRAGKGRVKAGEFRFLTNDFVAQLLEAINPFSVKDPYTKVKCATVLAAVEGGQVAGKPILVFSSDRLNVFSDATVNLANETIDVTFNTVPQKGLGLSLSNLINPYIKVSGTLAAPVLTLNAEQTIIEGTATVATGGLYIVAKGFKDRYLSSKDPCGKRTRKPASTLRQ